MNKDELKKKMLKERFLFIDKTGEPHMAIKVDKFTELIDQLDEPEKVVVPDFVGKWIRHCKRFEADLFWAMTADDMDEKTSSWIEDCDLDVFARAWLDGYTVEEKKYRVRVAGKHYLFLNHNTGALSTAPLIKTFSEEQWTFTEEQIKGINPNYWPFAEEVTE